MKDLMTFTEAAKLCPGNPSSSALSRWRREGVKSRSGETVHLECLRSGKQYFTSEKWLRKFFVRLAELDQKTPVSRSLKITSGHGAARSRLVQEGVLS